MRKTVASILLVLYGAACCWAYFNHIHAFLAFAAVSIIAMPFVLAQMVKRVFIGLVIGGLLAGVSVVFPPAAIIAAIFGIVMLITKFQRFARNLPYLLTSCGAYAFLWYAPIYTVHAFRAPGADRYYFAGGLALAGIVVLLLFVGIMVWFMDAAWARTVLFTIGYGWYLVFFLLTFLIPDDDDGDDTDWDDDR